MTHSSATVQWRLPLRLNGDLRFFTVTATPTRASAEDGLPEMIRAREELPRYQHLLQRLAPGTSYNVTVRCGLQGLPAALLVTTSDLGADPVVNEFLLENELVGKD